MGGVSIAGAQGSQPIAGTEPAPSTGETTQPVASLMPDPVESMATSGDAIMEIAALLIQSSRDDRKSARKSAAMEERLIMQAGRNRVAQMREKADDIRREGLVGGLTQAAGGTLTCVGACAYARPEEGEIDGAAAFSGGGRTVEGLGSAAAKSYSAAAAEHDAKAAEHETQSEAARRREEGHRDDVRDAEELLGKVADFIKQMKQSEQAAKQAALYRA